MKKCRQIFLCKIPSLVVFSLLSSLFFICKNICKPLYASAIRSTVHVIMNGMMMRLLNVGALNASSASGVCFRLFFLCPPVFAIAVGTLESTTLPPPWATPIVLLSVLVSDNSETL